MSGQRRKGNVSSASSARAAELLSSSGHSLSFLGFDGSLAAAPENHDFEPGSEIDGDLILIFKKLAKKDPQTREKALRELLETLIAKESGMQKISYNYYTTIFDKLSLDSSASVRSLSIKVLRLFIEELKKGAEKNLDKVIPFVLMASCDPITSVANGADALMNACFPNKVDKVILLFSKAAIDNAVQLISLIHPLNKPQKFDEEESQSQRDYRILSQSARLLSKMVDMVKDDPKFVNALAGLFRDDLSVNKILSGSYQVQFAFLRLCIQSEEFVETVLTSVIPKFLLKNLDSDDIGRICFEVLIYLLQDDRFHNVIDLKKSVIPRLIFVIRKKSSQRYDCFEYFLPATVLVAKKLSECDRLPFSFSILESFLDNMPLQNPSFVSKWTKAFVETARFVVKNATNPDILKKSNDLIIAASEYVYGDVAAEGEFAAFINCLSEESVMPSIHFSNFINILQFNALNRRTDSDMFIAELLKPCNSKLYNFHVGVLRNPNGNPLFFQGIASCEEEYVEKLMKEFNLLDIVYKIAGSCQDQIQLENLAKVAVKILTRSEGSIAPNDHTLIFDKHILVEAAKSGASTWEKCYNLIKTAHEDFHLYCQELAYAFMLANNYQDFKLVIENFDEALRESIFDGLLNLSATANAPFLAQCVRDITLSSETSERVSRSLMRYLFDFENPLSDKDRRTVLDIIAQLPSGDFLNNVVSSLANEHVQYSGESLDISRAKQIAAVTAELLELHDRFAKILFSYALLEEWIEAFDSQLFCRSLPALEAILPPADYTSTEIDVVNLNLYLKNVIGCALVHAQISLDDISDESCKIVTSAMLMAYTILKTFSSDNSFLAIENLETCMELLEKRFLKNAHAVQTAVKFLLTIRPSALSVAQSIRYVDWIYLKECSDYFASQTYPDIAKSALHIKLSWQSATATWITKYHSEYFNRKSDFIKLLYNEKEADLESDLFSITQKESVMELNLVSLLAASEFVEMEINSSSCNERSEVLDFVLCGLVTAMTSLDEKFNEKLPSTLPERSFLSLAVKLFSSCAKYILSCPADSILYKEWSDFYSPSLSEIIFRFWSALSADPTPSFLSTNLCQAICYINNVPTSLSLRPSYVDSLDLAGYDPATQTLITSCSRSIISANPSLCFSGLHVLKLLAPMMYRHENKCWTEEDDKITTSESRKVKIPVILNELVENNSGLPAFLAVDATLKALETLLEVNDERVSFCQVFSNLLSAIMPQLFDACIDENPLSDIEKQDFYVTTMMTSSNPAELLDRYYYNLLFKILRTVPAVVRSWYNSLPSNGAGAVNKYIKKVLSAALIEDELNSVKLSARSKKTDNLKIMTVPVAREVVAEYIVDETTMRLRITMSQDWPLSVPNVALEKSVATDRTKKWLFQLTSYLFHQNGPIVDGILTWQKSVDKDVEGTEACSICLMIVHSTSHQLPKARCKQCKHKFHSNCLYTWFQSSAKETCPLCRNHFLGSR